MSSTAKEVVVEVIRPSGIDGSQQTLAAFVLLGHEKTFDVGDIVRYDNIGVASLSGTTTIEEALSKRVPGYMVPTAWFRVDAMPLTISGKRDRRKLRDIGSSYSILRLNQQGAQDKRKPTNKIERTLQSLWNQLLGIDTNCIGLDDTFFRLGGDSLRAMSLVSAARKAGLGLSVAQIFQYPKLEDLARELKTKDVSQNSIIEAKEIKPFSLVSSLQQSQDELVNEVAKLCSVEVEDVEDIYPTTPLQQGLMALTTKRPGDYVLQNVMQIDTNTDCDRLQRSWEEAVQRTSTLRTRIIQHPSSDAVLQVVVKSSSIQWSYGDDLEAYLKIDKAMSMDLGESLVRFAIIRDGFLGHNYLVWTIHHAVYDGQSLPSIQNMVHHIYNDQPDMIPNHPGWNTFITYLLTQDENNNKAFWDNSLSGYNSSAFPPLPPTLADEVKADTSIGLSFEMPTMKESSVTLATTIRAAWALAVYHNTGSPDVVFGATLSGRGAPVPGIEDIIGPTIATVPVRVNIPQRDSRSTVSDFLLDVQARSTSMIPHEQFGLQNISKLSQDAQRGCDFKTLLVIQPHEDDELDAQTSSNAQLGVWREAIAQSGEFSTYPLTIVCRVSASGGMHLGCYLDPRILPQWRAERILNQFGFLIRQLSSMDLNKQIGEVDNLTPSDRELLWAWNEKVPDPVDRSVHDLILQRTKTQPDATAISAWDGEMSYNKLDITSSKLATHFINDFGINAGAMIPLYFDKSVFAVVSMLAVLKAGAAFVPLDPTRTRDNRETILTQLCAKIILTSEHLAGDLQAEGTSASVVPVGPRLLSNLTSEPCRDDKVASPSSLSSAAYIIFTSGSTGQPKGVVLEHQAVATSCSHHGLALGLQTTSRVLQFASYAFDASIQEIITTLVYGGTICIPSTHNLQNNLQESIQTMSINTAYLTPSVANLIDPAAVPELTTLMLAGEASTTQDLKRWSRPHQTLLHGYGPTECAVLCSVATVNLDSAEIEPACIGTATGGTSWIVDQDDHNKLLPIGAVGELLVEGYILAKGYFHDQAKTEATFIDTPTWLSQGLGGQYDNTGRRGRLYKTGDLVSYNPDGSLNFIGRKDTQVKIRGQRVELAGVEAAVLQSISSAVQVVAEIINPTGQSANPVLAAFVVLSNSDAPASFNKTHNGMQVRVLPLSTTFEAKISEVVPSYMIPSVCFVVDDLPRNISGKTDRKKLRDMGSSFSTEELASLQRTEGAEKRRPSTDAEKLLCGIVAKVLNLDVASVGLDDSFFRLGGDSITAMQLSSAARLQGLDISVARITRLKTLGLILEASIANDRGGVPDTNGVHVEALNDSAVTLTPIQQMFFLQQTDPKVCYDQFFYLRPKTPIAQPQLLSALHKIVEAHPILRAHYKQNSSGNWEQFITRSAEESVRCISHTCSDYQQVASVIQDQRGSLDPTAGPLVVAVLFEVNGEQTLFIVIHHLVVDLVSWRIILGDLETLLVSRSIEEVSLAPSTTSFQTWSTLQAQHARDLVKSPRHQMTIPAPQISYWGSEATRTSLGADTTTFSFSVDESTTTAILGACNEAMGTRPIELMISALLFSFGQTFQDRALPTVLNEGHGREAWDESLDLDLSRTVGWFTTLYPVRLDPTITTTTIASSHVTEQRLELLNIVTQTHNAMTIDSSSDKGTAWFTSQFATPESAQSFVQKQLPAEIVFNYGGVYQQLERDDSFFKVTSLEEMANSVTDDLEAEAVQDPGRVNTFNIDPPSSAEPQLSSLFEFVAGVTRGRLHVSVLYSKKLSRQEKIEEWLFRFEDVLKEISRELSTK
jgi:amino acid adenylation domain-containing protein